jgi:hypothetical protein
MTAMKATKRITKKRSKTPSKKWFINVRGSYLPNSWQATLLYIPFIAYLIGVLVTVSHQDTTWFSKVMVTFVQFVAAGIVMTWIASKTS